MKNNNEIQPSELFYVIGDAGGFYNPLEQIFKLLPQTAQVATQQGKWLAIYLNTQFSTPTKRKKPFRHRYLGMMAHLGDMKGNSDVPSASGGGFFAWVLWKVAYATMLPSPRSKF